MILIPIAHWYRALLLTILCTASGMLAAPVPAAKQLADKITQYKKSTGDKAAASELVQLYDRLMYNKATSRADRSRLETQLKNAGININTLRATSGVSGGPSGPSSGGSSAADTAKIASLTAELDRAKAESESEKRAAASTSANLNLATEVVEIYSSLQEILVSIAESTVSDKKGLIARVQALKKEANDASDIATTNGIKTRVNDLKLEVAKLSGDTKTVAEAIRASLIDIATRRARYVILGQKELDAGKSKLSVEEDTAKKELDSLKSGTPSTEYTAALNFFNTDIPQLKKYGETFLSERGKIQGGTPPTGNFGLNKDSGASPEGIAIALDLFGYFSGLASFKKTFDTELVNAGNDKIKLDTLTKNLNTLFNTASGRTSGLSLVDSQYFINLIDKNRSSTSTDSSGIIKDIDKSYEGIVGVCQQMANLVKDGEPLSTKKFFGVMGADSTAVDSLNSYAAVLKNYENGKDAAGKAVLDNSTKAAIVDPLKKLKGLVSLAQEFAKYASDAFSKRNKFLKGEAAGINNGVNNDFITKSGLKTDDPHAMAIVKIQNELGAYYEKVRTVAAQIVAFKTQPHDMIEAETLRLSTNLELVYPEISLADQMGLQKFINEVRKAAGLDLLETTVPDAPAMLDIEAEITKVEKIAKPTAQNIIDLVQALSKEEWAKAISAAHAARLNALIAKNETILNVFKAGQSKVLRNLVDQLSKQPAKPTKPAKPSKTTTKDLDDAQLKINTFVIELGKLTKADELNEGINAGLNLLLNAYIEMAKDFIAKNPSGPIRQADVDRYVKNTRETAAKYLKDATILEGPAQDWTFEGLLELNYPIDLDILKKLQAENKRLTQAEYDGLLSNLNTFLPGAPDYRAAWTILNQIGTASKVTVTPLPPEAPQPQPGPGPQPNPQPQPTAFDAAAASNKINKLLNESDDASDDRLALIKKELEILIPEYKEKAPLAKTTEKSKIAAWESALQGMA